MTPFPLPILGMEETLNLLNVPLHVKFRVENKLNISSITGLYFRATNTIKRKFYIMLKYEKCYSEKKKGM